MDDPLAALRPLHTPPPVAWWPPAPGWWLLVSLVVVFALLLLWRRNKSAPKRAALRELETLAQPGAHPTQRAAAINRLLKRYALACCPAAASLTGEAWLEFLDAHGGNGGFVRGPGRALLTAPYSREAGSVEELLPLVRQWIKLNRPEGRP